MKQIAIDIKNVMESNNGQASLSEIYEKLPQYTELPGAGFQPVPKMTRLQALL